MKLLLDTCTFLWAIGKVAELSDKAKVLLADPDNEVYLSAASTWEIAVKYSIGRLVLPEAPDRYVPKQRDQHGIEFLPLEEEATLHLSRLPHLHRDPFDRMLVCQAMVHGLVVVSPDPLIAQYPVRCSW